MIFVDTWAWVALAAKRDQHHQRASEQHQRFVRESRQYITTNFVLSELITHLYATLASGQAEQFISSIFVAAETGAYHLAHISPQQLRRAWDMRRKYADKPDISFVDFTSMVVMQDLGVTEIFTGDAHFQQVNLGFHLLP